MKRCSGRNLFSTMVIALLAGQAAYASTITDYFPVTPGRVWKYTEDAVIALGDMRMGPDPASTVYLFKTSMAGLRAFAKEGERVFEVRDGDRRLWYDFSAPVGETWTIEPFEGDEEDLFDGATVTLASRTDEVTVPYGTFSECVHFSFTPPPDLADAGPLDQWFAPGVGLIKMTVQTIQGPVSYELIELTDVDMPPPSPSPVSRLTVEVVTDRDTYGPGEPIRITVLAHNHGDSDITLEFRSALQVDYTIDWMYRWSIGKAFAQALTYVTIPAGGTYEWTFTHTPEDARLLAGEHEIVGEIVDHYASGSKVVWIEGPVGAVRGTVTGDGKALSGVELSMETMMARYEESVPLDVLASVKFHRVAVTDHDGRFVFEDVPVGGTYSINAFAKGFEPYFDTFEMGASEKTLDISLTKTMAQKYVNRYSIIRNGMRYEMGTTDYGYPKDGTVEMIYRASNLKRESVTFSFASDQRYDFALTDAERNEVWRWSSNKRFVTTASELTLRRGEWVEFEETLNLSGLDAGGWLMLSGWLATSSSEDTKLSLPLWIDPSGELAVLRGTVIEDRGPLEIWVPLEGVHVVAKPEYPAPPPIWGDVPEGTDAEEIEEIPSAQPGQSGEGVAVGMPPPIEILPPLIGEIIETVTGADGAFRMDGLYPGVRYWVHTFKEGYEPQTVAITVKPGDNDLLLSLPKQEPVLYLNAISEYRDGMRYEIAVRRHFYAPKDTVRIRYRVTNVDRDLVTLEFSSTQQYDFVLRGESGDLWRWSEGRGFGEIMQFVPLERGRSLTFKEALPLADLRELDGPVALFGHLTLSNSTYTDLSADDTEIYVKFIVGETSWVDVVPVEDDWEEAEGVPPVAIRVPSVGKGPLRAMEVRMSEENAYGVIPGYTFINIVEIRGDEEGSNAEIRIRYDREELNARGIDENALEVFYLNDTVWERVESRVDMAANIVQAELPYLGTVGLFARNQDPTAVDDERSAMPHEFALAQNHPNPFNPTTTISFVLPTRAHVRLEIYNVRGQLIRTLLNAEVESGERQVVWDGKNDRKRNVTSGVYFYRLLVTEGRWSATRKMMLIR